MEFKKYKIIGIDNFNRDNVNDILVCDNLTEYYGRKILNFLLSDTHANSPYFYQLVDENHKLYEHNLY